MLNKKELFDYFKEHPNGNTQERIFKLKYPLIYDDIMTWDFPKEFKWAQKIYHYFNNDTKLELGKCSICGCRCSFISIKNGYNVSCKKHMYVSRKCNLKSLNLNKDESFRYLLSNPKGNIEKPHFEKRFPELYRDIELINFPNNFKWTQKLYHFFHNDLSFKLGICPICGTRCKFKTFNEGYHTYCSVKCMNNDPIIQNKMRETSIKHFGVPHPAQSNLIKDKIRLTTFETYGVEHYSQTNNFAKYHRKRIQYDGLTFDSSWEIKVYKYCMENNIPFEYQPSISFEYVYNNKIYIYQPDFLINGKLYEIKGDHYNIGPDQLFELDNIKEFLKVNKFKPLK